AYASACLTRLSFNGSTSVLNPRYASDALVVSLITSSSFPLILSRSDDCSEPANCDCPLSSSAIPVPDPKKKSNRIFLRGDVPSPIDPPTGCRFHTRCPFATELCRTTEPTLERKDKEIDENHEVACHYALDIERGIHKAQYEMHNAREVLDDEGEEI